jgi:hypothetical protein
MGHSISEKSFGNREAKGNEMNTYIQHINGYNPSNDGILKAKFPLFMQAITQANSDVSSANVKLQTNRFNRLDMYYGSEGLKKLAPRIRDYVASFPEGRKSANFIRLQKLCAKLRSAKKPKKAKDKSVPLSNEETKTRSTSELSFGAMYRVGMDILETIKQIPNYTPSASITVAAFTAFLEALVLLDNSVAAAYSEWDKAIKARFNLYQGDEGLRDKFQQIKNYLASEFGKDSNVYKDARKIKY